MQIILENQEQFDTQVVDKALEDLNNSMHRPLVSQEELDAVENEANEQFDAQHETNNNNNGVSTQDIDDILNGSPIDEYLK